MDKIDTVLLIQEVSLKPVLWDKYQSSYKGRNATKYAWREVCRKLNPKFGELKTIDQDTFFAEVIKKWTNLRDSYLKYKKKLKVNTKNGSLRIKMKKYIYADQLEFLTPIFNQSNINEKINKEKDHTEAEDSISDLKISKPSRITKNKIKLKKNIKTDDKVLKDTEEEKPCSKMAFLQSLMPHLEKFNNTEFLQFQMGTLKVIENIYKTNSQQVPTYFQSNFINEPSSSVQFITPDNIKPLSVTNVEPISISPIISGDSHQAYCFDENSALKDEDDSIDINMLT
ncbi:uncharacterized protein LOC119683521 [Teleopsis dalmanni]|uniref:uncharacterized protein LOC119683521 n=1 Tax=Teleopsis dalmanni TaxID=139649 RepID=UPI0018CD4159|nr:uncharacterized protein LOC119683521 [Teleopsis dalmanni]